MTNPLRLVIPDEVMDALASETDEAPSVDEGVLVLRVRVRRFEGFGIRALIILNKLRLALRQAGVDAVPFRLIAWLEGDASQSIQEELLVTATGDEKMFSSLTGSSKISRDFPGDAPSSIERVASSTSREAAALPLAVDSVALTEPRSAGQLRSRADALSRVAFAGTQVELWTKELDDAVEAARHFGATWREVGDSVGVRPQSAQRRWTESSKQRHRDYQRERRQND